MSEKKKIRKPKNIKTNCWGGMEVSLDWVNAGTFLKTIKRYTRYCYFNVTTKGHSQTNYISLCTVSDGKKLYKWLGQAIKFLEEKPVSALTNNKKAQDRKE